MGEGEVYNEKVFRSISETDRVTPHSLSASLLLLVFYVALLKWVRLSVESIQKESIFGGSVFLMHVMMLQMIHRLSCRCRYDLTSTVDLHQASGTSPKLGVWRRMMVWLWHGVASGYDHHRSGELGPKSTDSSDPPPKPITQIDCPVTLSDIVLAQNSST